MPRMRYIGPYGRGKRPAYVSGVGEVFFGQIVDIPKEKFDKKQVEAAEWEDIGNTCGFFMPDGHLCTAQRAEGSDLCLIHIQQVKSNSIGKINKK